jgi:hypothetical protein
MPPNVFRPSPLTSPGFASVLKVYTARPLYESCVILSLGRTNEAQGAGKLPGGGVTGGQKLAQAPVQLEEFGVPRSASKTYTVCWFALTKPGLPLSDAVLNGAPDDGASVAALVGGVEGMTPPEYTEPLPLPPPQPEASNATAQRMRGLTMIDLSK